MVSAMIGLTALYLLMPQSMAGTDYLPDRMPALLLAVALAGCVRGADMAPMNVTATVAGIPKVDLTLSGTGWASCDDDA